MIILIFLGTKSSKFIVTCSDNEQCSKLKFQREITKQSVFVIRISDHGIFRGLNKIGIFLIKVNRNVRISSKGHCQILLKFRM